jgi:putative transposase
VEHVVGELGVSERRACRVLNQHRSTQRKIPKRPDNEAALTAEIIDLASRYGRYGYRRVTALLRLSGWRVNRKRVARIWRREGLKVPSKQPKRGRLWFNDGSCIRLRPEYPNHVWSYDFVADRTHEGKAYRMLCIIDEFTREALAIRVARRLRATDVIDARSVHPARSTGLHPVGQRPGVRRPSTSRLDRGCRREDRVHRTRQPVGKRLLRELQREAA